MLDQTRPRRVLATQGHGVFRALPSDGRRRRSGSVRGAGRNQGLHGDPAAADVPPEVSAPAVRAFAADIGRPYTSRISCSGPGSGLGRSRTSMRPGPARTAALSDELTSVTESRYRIKDWCFRQCGAGPHMRQDARTPMLRFPSMTKPPVLPAIVGVGMRVLVG